MLPPPAPNPPAAVLSPAAAAEPSTTLSYGGGGPVGCVKEPWRTFVLGSKGLRGSCGQAEAFFELDLKTGTQDVAFCVQLRPIYPRPFVVLMPR